MKKSVLLREGVEVRPRKIKRKVIAYLSDGAELKYDKYFPEEISFRDYALHGQNRKGLPKKGRVVRVYTLCMPPLIQLSREMKFA